LGCSSHSLRHTYVSLLVSAGLPLAVISEMVGHNNPTTTLNIYTHLLNQDKTTASNMISEKFGNLKSSNN